MRILCDVNRTECLRYGIDASSSVVAVEIDPKLLTQDQRNFIVTHLYEHLRFPTNEEFSICPPTYAGLIASVRYGLQCEQEQRTRQVRGGSINLDRETLQKLAEFRHNLIKLAVAEDDKTQKNKTA
jgi:hypothetical protein